MAACYIKSVKRKLVIIKGFIMAIINIVRKNWMYPWWCVCALYVEQSVTLARLRCNHPDDGRRPKHVGAVLI